MIRHLPWFWATALTFLALACSSSGQPIITIDAHVVSADRSRRNDAQLLTNDAPKLNPVDARETVAIDRTGAPLSDGAPKPDRVAMLPDGAIQMSDAAPVPDTVHDSALPMATDAVDAPLVLPDLPTPIDANHSPDVIISDAVVPDAGAVTPGPPLFGLNIDPSNPGGNPSPQVLGQLEVGSVRIEFHSHQLGVTGGEFAAYPQIPQLAQAGIQVLLLVDYSTLPGKPDFNASDAVWDAYSAQFATQVGQIAMHYAGGVTAYEVWNEPDNPPGNPAYDPGVPAAAYGRMLSMVAAAIRQADAQALVISGGLDSGQVSYVQGLIQGAGGSFPADALGFHPYGSRAPNNWPSSSFGFGDLSSGLLSFSQAAGAPVWVTEIGSNSLSGQELADYVTNIYRQAEQLGPSVVPRVFWFCYSDAMVNGFGLVNADGSNKPAATAYAEEAQGTAPGAHAPEIVALHTTLFTVPGDAAPTIRVDVDLAIPPGLMTQPLGDAADSCTFYDAGQDFRQKGFAEIMGDYRIGIDTTGALAARDQSGGVDHPFRFALLFDGCNFNGSNHSGAADPGIYTVTGFAKLSPGDETDGSQYFAGLVQEDVGWVQDRVFPQ